MRHRRRSGGIIAAAAGSGGIAVGMAVETDSAFDVTPVSAGAGANPSHVATSTVYVSSSGATSHTFGYTAATTGSNRKGFVFAARQTDLGAADITGVTYNNQNIFPNKFMDEFQDLGGTVDVFIEGFYIDHQDMPTDGASHNIVITCGNMNVIAAFVEYKDMKQGAPDVATVANGTTVAGDPVTLNFSGIPAGAAIIGAAVNATTTSFDAVAGQNERADAGGTGNAFTLLVTDKLAATGGSDSMTCDAAATGGTRFAAAAWGPSESAGASIFVGMASEADTVHAIPTSSGTIDPSFVAKSSPVYVSSAASATHSFNYAAAIGGAGRKLLFASSRQVNGVDILSVKLGGSGGTDFTKVFDTSNVTASPDIFVECWQLDHDLIPNDGVSRAVFVTMAAAANLVAGVCEYKNVKQGPPDALSNRGPDANNQAVLPGDPTASPPPPPPPGSKVWPGSLVFGIGVNDTNRVFDAISGQNNRFQVSGVTSDAFSFFVADKLNVEAVGGEEIMVCSQTPTGGQARFVACAYRSDGALGLPMGLSIETDTVHPLAMPLVSGSAAFGGHAFGGAPFASGGI